MHIVEAWAQLTKSNEIRLIGERWKIARVGTTFLIISTSISQQVCLTWISIRRNVKDTHQNWMIELGILLTYYFWEFLNITLSQNPVELLENPVELPQNLVELPQDPVELPQNPVEFHQNPVELLYNVRALQGYSITHVKLDFIGSPCTCCASLCSLFNSGLMIKRRHIRAYYGRSQGAEKNVDCSRRDCPKQPNWIPLVPHFSTVQRACNKILPSYKDFETIKGKLHTETTRLSNPIWSSNDPSLFPTQLD